MDHVKAITTPSVEPAVRSALPLWRELLVLFKLREVLLLLLAAVGGAFLAAGGWPGAGHLAVLLVCGGLAAGGASAINEYLEADLDGRMERTRRRPLITGSIARRGWVPALGALMILGPALAALPFNAPLSFFLVAGAAIYIGIYTLWLKPRTWLNIVVGGAAGSAAVLSGSAAAGSWHEPGALWLALLVFLWTPTHFWSLAIAYRDDYARGGFPMLPVQVAAGTAARWVLLHTAGTVLAAAAIAVHLSLDLPWLIAGGLTSLALLIQSLRLVASPGPLRALSLFRASNLYLGAVLLLICLHAVMA